MTPKRQRLYIVIAALSLLSASAGLALYGLSDNLVFFYSPKDIAEQGITPGQRFRLGGLVEAGSVSHDETNPVIRFVVTDTVATLPVAFAGTPPALFREGQGVIAEGAIDAAGVFIADTLLAKHDETYMPKEVADALKDAGHWQGDGETP